MINFLLDLIRKTNPEITKEKLSEELKNETNMFALQMIAENQVKERRG